MRRVRVGDVLQLQRRAVSIDPATEYRLIGVYSFGKGIFHREPKIGAELGNYKFFAIEPGDLVLSNIQAWEGAIGFATEADRGTVGTHRFLAYTAIDPDEIDTNWARYLFLSEAGFPLIQKAAPGSVTRNRTLAVERFEALEIPLPDIDEQRRVAAHLDRVASCVQRLKGPTARSAALSEALVVSMSSRPDLAEAAKERDGWERMQLSEFLRPATDPEPVQAGTEYRIAGVYSFGKGLIDRGSLRGADTSYPVLWRLGAGDLVFSKLGAWEGAVAVVGDEFEGFSVSSEFPVFTPNPGVVEPSYLDAVARSPWFWQVINAGTRGSMARRKRITATQFLLTEIWVPPLAEQRVIAGRLRLLDASATGRSARTGRVEALVPSALNRVFAGLA